MNRREFVKTGMAAGAALALPDLHLFAQGTPLIQKKIPSSGEMIPIIGLGTRDATRRLRATQKRCR